MLKKKFERYQSNDKYFMNNNSSTEEDGEADIEKCINVLNI